MEYRDLKQEIDLGKMGGIYLFRGREDYIMDACLLRIKEKFIDPNFEALNYIEIGENASFDDILNACETLAFMSPKKLVYIKDIQALLNKDKTISDKLNDYLGQLDDSLILIIRDRLDSLKKSTKIYKTIARLGKVVEFKRLNQRELAAWINRIVKSKNRVISNNNLIYFIEKTGYLDYRSEKSLFQLENEILKIVDHGQTKEISREDIDSNLVEKLDKNIFKLLDAIMAKDRRLSLETLDEMLRLNEATAKILFMIIRQFRLLAMYKSLYEKGYSQMDIRSKMGISPFEFKKIASRSGSYTMETLQEILSYLLMMDRQQKTSSYDEKLAIEMLLVRLTSN